VAMLLFSGVSNDTSVSHRAHAKMASIQSAEIS
jgi:hypothetical protein